MGFRLVLGYRSVIEPVVIRHWGPLLWIQANGVERAGKVERKYRPPGCCHPMIERSNHNEGQLQRRQSEHTDRGSSEMFPLRGESGQGLPFHAVIKELGKWKN